MTNPTDALFAEAAAHWAKWQEHGDVAALDDAISGLTAATAFIADWDSAWPELQAELAMLHGTRSEVSDSVADRLADLDAATDCARAAIAWLSVHDGDEASASDLRILLGLALMGRFRLAEETLSEGDSGHVAAARADRDAAIEEISGALSNLDPRDPDWLELADDVAVLRYARFNDPWPDAQPPAVADLDQAIELLSQVVDATDADSAPGFHLVFALIDRLNATSDPADLDELIGRALSLLEHPATEVEDVRMLHDLLGDAYLDRADLAAPGSPARRADLGAAIGCWEAALAATQPTEEDYPRLAERLATASWLRIAGTSASDQDIDRLVGHAERAWQVLEPGEDRARTGLYLAVGTHEILLRPDQTLNVEAIDAVVAILRQAEPMLAGLPDERLVVVVELGHFLVARAQETGLATDLEAARPWLSEAITALASVEQAHGAALVRTVAADMFVLASLEMGIDDLDAAIGLLHRTLANPGELDEVTVYRAALGLAYLQRASFSQRQQDFAAGLEHLVAAFEMTETGDPFRLFIAWNLGSAFLIRLQRGGDIQDLDAARYYLGVLGEDAMPATEAVRALGPDMDIIRTATTGLLRLSEGLGGDTPAFDEAVRLLRTAVSMLPVGHASEGRLRGDLGLALAFRAGSLPGGDQAGFEEAEREITTAMRLLPLASIIRPVMVLRLAGAMAGAAAAAKDPARLQAAIDFMTTAVGEIDPAFGGRVRLIATLGGTFEMLYQLTSNAGALDSAAQWYLAACRELASGQYDPVYATCLIRLARVQRARGLRVRARESGLEALAARGREVLLQSGTERGLAIARTAAQEAAEIAGWCLADRDLVDAVAAMELGRGLVLHAATQVASVPELLAQTGRSDLAAQWHATGPADHEPPWDAGLTGPQSAADLLGGLAGLELPSDLRARTLSALSGPVLDRLLAPPSLAEIRTALAVTGSDALVYLLEPTAASAATPAGAVLPGVLPSLLGVSGTADRAAGHAIVVPSARLPGDRGPQVITLPQLAGTGAGIAQLEQYATAIQSVVPPSSPDEDGPMAASGHREDRRLAEAEWRRALVSVCEWAWPAVVAPLLELARSWGVHRPPRLVIVAAGRLSLVPWHAAYCRSDTDGRVQYACTEAVISYAASARQLIDVSRRPAISLQTQPVIVGNPSIDLTYAGLEAQAIRDQCYPGGTYLGHATATGGRAADGAGTPDEVLAQLPQAGSPGASLLHLACHAHVVGSAPGRSFLLLADAANLTVETVLRRASGRPADAPGGLVSLAACASDLTITEQDEALTLATAFLASGAVTVVGTRWLVQQGPTAVMMFMFHHYLTADGMSPREALRQTQIWMLDPDRTAPAQMPPHLADAARLPELAELFVWGALTHQGR